jgi:hypothetical protein
MALFSSLAELRADISSRGRDAFVADLVENHGSTPISHKTGIIYALICRVDFKIYVGQTTNFHGRMRGHFRYEQDGKCLKNAIKKHGRENFLSVILLAGIERPEELDLIEIAVIKDLECMAWGYNLCSGGRRKREVVITIFDPFLEITYLSVNEAAKAMSSVAIIHKLVNSKFSMHATCTRGEYANAFFTARFREV